MVEEIIKFPRASFAKDGGRIVKWFVQVGDLVSSGDIIAEIDTDVATMELESYIKGKVKYIGPKENEWASVGATLIVLET